jgi:Kdo2-lipid IVA 3' secondary acyltransferase
MDSLSCDRERKRPSKGIPHFRVDNIPVVIRPIYLTVAWAIALALYLYYGICRLTSRISIEGDGDLSRHSIFCMWHESWWSYFVVFLRYRSDHAMISHPAAYMKPLHCLFRLMGIRRLFLGSSGHEGQQAVNELARLVKEGASTTISPDGPAGPARSLKKGVLHLSLQSGVPIVPVTISASHSINIPSWDSKKHPLPFSRIRVMVHEPIYVDRDNFNDAAMRINSALMPPLM